MWFDNSVGRVLHQYRRGRTLLLIVSLIQVLYFGVPSQEYKQCTEVKNMQNNLSTPKKCSVFAICLALEKNKRYAQNDIINALTALPLPCIQLHNNDHDLVTKKN